MCSVAGDSFCRLGFLDQEEDLVVFDRLAILHEDLRYPPVDVRFDFVHQLHRFNDAQHRAHADALTNFNIGFGIRRGSPVERANDGRADFMMLCLRLDRGLGRRGGSRCRRPIGGC